MSTVAEGAKLPGSGTPSRAGRGWAGWRLRRLRPLRTRVRRALRLVIATLLLMLALEAVFLLLLAPRLHLTTVNVATELALSDAEVLAMAGLAGDEQFFSLDAAAIEARLEQNLLVRDAVVSMRFPDTLRLDLAARTAAAVLLAVEPDGSSRAALVDRDGLVFLAGVAPWRHQDAADVPAQPYRYLPVRKQDYIGPNADRDPGRYRLRTTAGFVRGVLRWRASRVGRPLMREGGRSAGFKGGCTKRGKTLGKGFF